MSNIKDIEFSNDLLALTQDKLDGATIHSLRNLLTHILSIHSSIFNLWAPLIYRRANLFLESQSIPQAQLNKLQERYLYVSAKNMLLQAEIKAIADECFEADIPVVFFKGAALLYTVYKDDIGVRQMYYIDVLIEENNLLKIEDMLRSWGFKFSENVSREECIKRKFHLAYKKEAIIIELHWRLDYEIDNMPLAYFLEAGACSKISGANITVLSPEANLLAMILNQRRTIPYNWTYLELGSDVIFYRAIFFLYEINLLIKKSDKLDWGKVVSLANRGKIEYEVASLLMLSKRIYKTEIPEEILRQLDGYFTVWLFEYLLRRSSSYKRIFILRDIILKMHRVKFDMKGNIRKVSGDRKSVV